jgi:hypothetical protein
MSRVQTANGLRRVVVTPVVGQGDISLVKFVLVWLGCAVINTALLALGFFVFTLLDVQAADLPTEQADEVATTTEVEEPQREPDLTNPDIGMDDTLQLNYNNDRIDPADVSVPGPVDPIAPVGVVGAPEDAVRANVPIPPGAGSGTGGSPLLADAGTGSIGGTPGGMGGNFYTGAFAGRSAATREKMVTEGGGSQISEAAVARGLDWLALHQSPGPYGHWGLHNFHRFARDKLEPGAPIRTCNCDPGTSRNNDIAATGFALLPFLAAGVTHKPASAKNAQKDYTKVVKTGLDYLMKQQGSDGSYSSDMYSHGIATIAMCEAFGLTSDPTLKLSAQKALNFIVAAQDTAGGGWRYAARMPGDTSVTGWELMAIKSGQMSGLSVPRTTLRLAEKFLDSVETSQKGTFSYTPGGGATPSMTAVGLLCRQYQGVNPRNPALLAGVEYLKKTPPGTGGLYYDYYATQVFHHMGGESWQFWNQGPSGKGGIRDMLIARQEHKTGSKTHIEGSWRPDLAPEGGRIMATSLSLLCLEVYYRHLPLYRRDAGVNKADK